MSGPWENYQSAAAPAQANPAAGPWTKYAASSIPPDQMKAHIDDLYSKYSRSSQNNNPELQDKSFGDAVGSFAKGAIAEPLQGIGKMLTTNPLTTLSGLVDSHVNAMNRARDAYASGDYPSAVMHGISALTPVVGPQAVGIGEKIGSGKVAEGLGEAATLAAPLARGAVSKVAGRVGDALRPAPKPEGLSPIPLGPENSELVNQTTQTGKARLAKYGPDIQKAGIGGKAADMKSLADSQLKKLGPQIGAESAKLDASGALPDLSPVHARIDDLIDKHSVNGVAINKPVVSKLQEIKQQLDDAQDGGFLKYSDLDKLRKTLDESVDYVKDGKSVMRATKATAGAIRDVLSNMDGADGINALKANYSLYSKVRELADTAKPNPVVQPVPAEVAKPGVFAKAIGHYGAGTVGAAAGHTVGGPVGGILGYAGGIKLGDALTNAIASGRLRTATSSFRNKVADSIAKGDFTTANKLAAFANGARLQEQQ